jgi:TrmH family RNA methyltransferase
MITSVKNPRIKAVRALQSKAKNRREEGVFVLEGVRLVEEAVQAGWNASLCLYTTDLNPRGMAVVDSLAKSGVPVEPVSPHVMKSASDTQTPQGILLVVEANALPLPEQLDFLLILDRVGDPGNVGTLLRTATAAGVDAVLLTEGSVDPTAPKVVRAGMGAHFRLPVRIFAEGEILNLCEGAGLHLWSASAGAERVYSAVDLTSPIAVIIGSEAHGVSECLHRAAQPLQIPMPGGGESLNAAVAGAVLLFEVVRQRNLLIP